MEEERVYFRIKSFFYLETLGRKGDLFSLDNNIASVTPKIEGPIYSFKDNTKMDKDKDNNKSIEE